MDTNESMNPTIQSGLSEPPRQSYYQPSVGNFDSEISDSLDHKVWSNAARGEGSKHGGRHINRRILIIDCLMDGSHTHIQRLTARALAARGHDVTWLTIKDRLYWVTDQDRASINFRTFETDFPSELVEEFFEYWTKKSLSGELGSFTWYVKMRLGFIENEFQRISEATNVTMWDMFLNTDFDELRALKFDMVLCEVMTPWCSIIAHDILKVPFINTINGGYLGTRYSRWYNQPSPLSYVPEFLTYYSDTMSFTQRVKNVIMHGFSLLTYDYMMLGAMDKEKNRLGLSPGIGTKEIISRSELFLYNWDFLLEFPRPVTPNVIMIGGLTIAPPKPLSQELEEFVQGSGEHGVAVFSVSTLLHVMNMEMANMIGAALARIPQRVVWKYLGEEKPHTLGNNTMLVRWISQQDLIAHEKTRLLIYHGGLNGGYEAMYYGVPILGLPLFTDQIDDLVRLKVIGMAHYFPRGPIGLTSEVLYQGIREVVDNSSYLENAKIASRKMHDMENTGQGLPMNRTLFWIEYAIEHGTDHLRTQIEKLAWYELCLLDVMGIVLVITIVFVWLLPKCCLGCARPCSRTASR
ncbi:UDP-glucuronosyltransferase 2C1-like isoform X2 [Asterias rubens]|nr:UDP-glucuronosyltransferase 2C1-like isoform X2 [Asterias rubens]